MNRSALRRGVVLSAALSVSAVSLLAAPVSAAPGTLALVATSNDGSVFDLDEYDAGDITVQVTDSVAGDVDVDDAQDLGYYWLLTPFDGAPASVRLPATGTDVADTDTAGEFVVPLPTGQESGSYQLVAGLGPDGQGAGAVAEAPVLTVRAGSAELVLDGSDPLRAAAGGESPVAGRLVLEDGSGLEDRALQLDYLRGTAGTDPEPDAGFVPAAPDVALVSLLSVTTTADGAFSAVVSDPAEEGQGTELGGSVEAATVSTPGIGDAGAITARDLDFVGESVPAGSTMVVSALGGGTPGTPLGATATVTAPDDTYDVDPTLAGVQGDGDLDRDPVVGQLYTVTVDKGFLTTGAEELPSTVGAPAGNLETLGRTVTGLTGPAGEIDFQAAIERDPGFDDDGRVRATATVTAGALSRTSAADWDSGSPLNGGQVKIVLSPAGEQVAPVNPALEGNRTYFDVFTLDQFGNRVGDMPVDLAFSGDLDNWDYSQDFVSSDFRSNGDFWVVSFEAGRIGVTGTWNAATYRYDDTAGNAVADGADFVGTASAPFYELDFAASRFSIRSDSPAVVPVGDAVTQTVRVVDQRGNPVRGYRVQFFRFGPDTSGGEPKATKITNDRGEAFYTFVGSELGRARTTAIVTDGTLNRTLTKVVTFGDPITARLSGAGNGRAADRLTVKAQPKAAGARVTLFKVVKGKRTAVAVRRLDATGAMTFTVRDRNGARATAYVAQVRATGTTVADTSNVWKVR